MKIHTRLKRLREELTPGLSQKNLGNILGMSQKKISRLENGDTHLQDEDIIEYCLFFRVRADYILGLSNERDMYPNDKLNKKR